MNWWLVGKVIRSVATLSTAAQQSGMDALYCAVLCCVHVSMCSRVLGPSSHSSCHVRVPTAAYVRCPHGLAKGEGKIPLPSEEGTEAVRDNTEKDTSGDIDYIYPPPPFPKERRRIQVGSNVNLPIWQTARCRLVLARMLCEDLVRKSSRREGHADRYIGRYILGQ